MAMAIATTSSTEVPETVDQVENGACMSYIITLQLCLRQVTLFGYCW